MYLVNVLPSINKDYYYYYENVSSLNQFKDEERHVIFLRRLHVKSTLCIASSRVSKLRFFTKSVAPGSGSSSSSEDDSSSLPLPYNITQNRHLSLL